MELKQPRVIDVVPIDFESGELVEREGKPTKRLRGQIIYLTNADVTLRRLSGGILVIDRYEVFSISDDFYLSFSNAISKKESSALISPSGTLGIVLALARPNHSARYL